MKVTTVAYFIDGDGDAHSITTTVHSTRDNAVQKVVEWMETIGLEQDDIEEGGWDDQLSNFLQSRKPGPDCHLSMFVHGVNYLVVLEEMSVD